MEPITILIADDHPMIRHAITSVIDREEDLELVGQASHGLEAVKLYTDHRPDVTLMDIAMPIMDGLEAIRRIREEDENAKIIVLTNFDTDEDILQGIKAGAMAYLLKDAASEHLIETIKKVNAGESFIPQHLLDRIERHSYLPDLSPREVDVLRLMMRGKSNRAIGVELGITESTVKSHVKNILIKMGVHDRTQAVTAAIQRGILDLNE